MQYSIIYYRYYVLGGTSLNYWGNRQPVLGEPLGLFTFMGSASEEVRTPKASLVREKHDSRDPGTKSQAAFINSEKT